MASSYSSLCDDFSLGMHVNTQLDLPSERDTILTFFERIQKQFPQMGNFYRKESGDFCLEEHCHGEKYRWVTLEIDRICVECNNPQEIEDAYVLQKLVLELSPYMLGVNQLDIDSLDVTFTMDFDYQGNHDEIIADAIFGSSAFGALLDMPEASAIGFSPAAVIALSKDCRTQARIAIESRTSVYQIRNQKYKSDLPITLYFTIRRYPTPQPGFNAVESLLQQCQIAEELMAEKIIPNFVQPLTNAIAQRR